MVDPNPNPNPNPDPNPNPNPNLNPKTLTLTLALTQAGLLSFMLIFFAFAGLSMLPAVAEVRARV